MSIQEALEELKAIQKSILNYLDDQNSSEDHFSNFEKKYLNIIQKDRHKFKLILCLLSNIANNRPHLSDFLSKIERILLLLKEDIIKNFTNTEIFNIFNSDKRILLFLIEEKIINIDENICPNLINSEKFIPAGYPSYFAPLLKEHYKYYDEESIPKNLQTEFTPDIYQKLKEGQNPDYLCELIRKDSINEFIAYVTQKHLSLESKIPQSFLETNSYLIEHQSYDKNHPPLYVPSLCSASVIENQKLTLIEYAAFYGATQIFNYLKLNNVRIEPSIMLFAIHCGNPDLIHIIEEIDLPIDESIHEKCFIESLKCHRNEIADYYANNFLSPQEVEHLLCHCVEYFNFEYMKGELIGQYFTLLCKYDYVDFVELLLKQDEVDVNKFLIFNNINF